MKNAGVLCGGLGGGGGGGGIEFLNSPHSVLEWYRKERKEMFYLTTHSTHLITVIWRHTYGKGPAAAT